MPGPLFFFFVLLFSVVVVFLGRLGPLVRVLPMHLCLPVVDPGPVFRIFGYSGMFFGVSLGSSSLGDISFSSGTQNTDLVKLAANVFFGALASGFAAGTETIFHDTTDRVPEAAVVARDLSSDSSSEKFVSCTVRNDTVAFAHITAVLGMFSSTLCVGGLGRASVATFFGGQGEGVLVIPASTLTSDFLDMGIRELFHGCFGFGGIACA